MKKVREGFGIADFIKIGAIVLFLSEKNIRILKNK